MSRASLKNRLRSWARRQLYSFFSSLGNLYVHPLGTMMTVLVLGIAMSLPLAMYVGVDNVDRIDLKRDRWGTITVFLTMDSPDARADDLVASIERRGDASATSVSPQQGMEEFRESSGFGDAVDMLGENPLPWVIHVAPIPRPDRDPEMSAVELASWLNGQEGVDSVQLDYKWMRRLASISGLGQALVSVMSLMFALAVVVVVANTIRLDVAARAEEIEVLSLVGASNSFVRQPFLYSGFWYGLLGAALALVLLNLALIYLDAPLRQLLEAYGNRFELSRPGASDVVFLLVGGGLLGLAGAWVSVERHIRTLGRAPRH